MIIQDHQSNQSLASTAPIDDLFDVSSIVPDIKSIVSIFISLNIGSKQSKPMSEPKAIPDSSKCRLQRYSAKNWDSSRAYKPLMN